VALGNGHLIDVSDLPPSLAEAFTSIDRSPDSPGLNLSSTDLEDIEKATIQKVFDQVKGDKAMAGRMLGISRATLYRKLKRYNIGPHAASPGSSALQ
jgi:transcriptional regulator of acetoin/glycerol metabolism